ncbi:sensor histidine kinase [Microbacterium album]|uniref:histidine kinase n=1 Tax=Microbacterium album TaxID=2053191 RepID=A0A917IF03_9MICO|nr:histidine kinase [Microbacterium album]GGH39910.1 two-component sensor histidine kinase [Microbacterium album]
MALPSSTTWRRLARRLSPATGRTRGEFATDTALTALAVVVGAATALPGASPQIPAWWWPWDLAFGALAAAAIWWTRRFPVAVAALMILPGTVAITAGVGVLVSVSRVGLLGPIRAAVLLTAVHIVMALPYHAVAPVPGMPWIVWVVVIPLLYSLCLCIGLLGRARQQVIAGLRASAARDRERYEERLSGARRDERERIAREMHDVLAHRISLLSMHAGALEYRATSSSPPDPQELSRAARIIRESAQGAVEDLRELLGLLRSDDELSTGAPQPRLDDLPRLVEEAAAAGQRVQLDSDLRGRAIREATQRTAYRVIQEALTNARKHAPHAAVTVQLRQSRDRLTILATNPLPPGVTRWDLPPAGNGLVGLEERVRIDGGWFSTGVEDGAFLLRAELPVGAR